ncbi:MAG: YkgJ family cysteine cluster protein [Desulfobacterales bacterium]|nr:YkgJ family cysteine cluster protein [Desulfobacterales bacterium]
MTQPNLPENVARIIPGEPFSFHCHQKIDCFTNCCRQLDLALTPYDALRMRKATGLHSSELLRRFIIVEHDQQSSLPQFYLTMVNDGKASCIFVKPEGCSIYKHRPGACRTYPLGRATVKSAKQLEEFFVLLKEAHCHGFKERTLQTIESFSNAQGLASYNYFNDLVAEILQHEKIRAGMSLTPKQTQSYITALYDIDTFRSKLKEGTIAGAAALPENIFYDDEQLLRYAINWVKWFLFSE